MSGHLSYGHRAGDLILYADENLVSQVVINLLKNAIQAIESDKIQIRRTYQHTCLLQRSGSHTDRNFQQRTCHSQ